MAGLEQLPTLNALLNATATVLLLAGYRKIRLQDRQAHHRLMTAAFIVSACFLVSYLVYHYSVGSVRFQGTGILRTLYLTILFTHSLLAAFVPILATITLVLGWRGRFNRHRRLARWTFPIWIYVSITGVIIYLMLYHL